jgi:hypothetical protein
MSKNSLDWLQVQTTIDADGHMTVTYSHTPEEFVAELQKRDERVYVAKGACAECIYTPDRITPLTRPMVEQMEKEGRSWGRVQECIRGGIAHYYQRADVPGLIICYAFYYRNVHYNPYLEAAKEAGLVTFYDVSDLQTLQESGLILTMPEWFH